MPGTALKIWARIDAFWFAPMPPERLAVARILIGCFALFRVSAALHSALRHADLELALVHPMGALQLVTHAPSSTTVRIVFGLAAVTGVALVIGWQQRLLAPLFAAAFFTITSYVNSFGMLYHTDQLLVLHLAVLALSPAADAWSLDARARSRRTGLRATADWRYGWPIRLLCALTVSIYWLAAVAKLAAHGWAWMLGGALRGQIAKDALRKQLLGSHGGLLGAFIWRNGWAASSVGIGTMLMELGAPLFLLSQRASRIWAAAAFAMHWGVFLIMGIKFRYQLCGIVFAPFFPTEQLVSELIRRLRRAPTLDPRDVASKPQGGA